MADQERFADLSGDFNPIHLDALVARRTAAGVPVVHGIHELLWCLDEIARSLGDLPPVAVLRANFDSFVAVGEPIQINLLKHDATGFRAEVKSGGALTMTLAVGFSDIQPCVTKFISDAAPFDDLEPVALTLEQMDGKSGRVALACTPGAMENAFPHAAKLLGAERAAGLGGLTRLVGMACPGLHSIFNGISLSACETEGAAGTPITYQVNRIDPRFRRLTQTVAGCGWTGTITCAARPPPTVQASSRSVAGLTAPDAFRGTSALIIGGSRGLGELTAKLIAGGGGKVTVTYATGREEAAALVQSIKEVGGDAASLQFDVLKEPGAQLAALGAAPTHVYYFATPPIQGSRSGFFNDRQFGHFVAFYVTGFARLVEALAKRQPDGFGVFYPSSVFVAERPRGMTEYAMAKAAGEILCNDTTTRHPKIRILAFRLPQLPTDQTAGLRDVETADPIAVLLPKILTLHQATV